MEDLKRWLGSKLIPFVDAYNHFTLFGDLLKGNNNKRFCDIIWLATT
jgi:hypothetical protein